MNRPERQKGSLSMTDSPMGVYTRAADYGVKQEPCGRNGPGETGGLADGQVNGWIDGRTDGQTDGPTDGWMDGWTDGCTDGWTDGLMNGCMNGRAGKRAESSSIQRMSLKQVASAPSSPAHELWRSGRAWSDLGAPSSSSPPLPSLPLRTRSGSGFHGDGCNPFRAIASRPLAKHPERLDVSRRSQSNLLLPPKSASMNGPVTYPGWLNGTLGGTISSTAAGLGSSAGDVLQKNCDGAGLQLRHVRAADGRDVGLQAGSFHMNGGHQSQAGSDDALLTGPRWGPRPQDERMAVDPLLCSPRWGPQEGRALQDERMPPPSPTSSPLTPRPPSPPPPIPSMNSETAGSWQGGFANGDVPRSPRAVGQAGFGGDALSSPLHSPRGMQPRASQETVMARVGPREGRAAGQEDAASVRSQQPAESGPRMISRLRSALNTERTARMMEKQRTMDLERKVAELEHELHVEYRRRETAEILLSEFRRRVRAESQMGCTCRCSRHDKCGGAEGSTDKGKRPVDGNAAVTSDSRKVSPREVRGQKPQGQDRGGGRSNLHVVAPDGKAESREKEEHQIVAAGASMSNMREVDSAAKKGGETVLQPKIAVRGKGDGSDQSSERELDLGLQRETNSWEAIATVLKQSSERRMNVGGRMKEVWQQLGKEMGSLADVWAEEEDVLMKNMAWLAQLVQRAQEDLQQAHEQTAALVTVNEWQAEQLRSIHQQRLDTWCHGLGDKQPVPRTGGMPFLGLVSQERGRLCRTLDGSQGESTDDMDVRKRDELEEGGGRGACRSELDSEMAKQKTPPGNVLSLPNFVNPDNQVANSEQGADAGTLDARVRALAALAIAEKGGLDSPAHVALKERGKLLLNGSVLPAARGGRKSEPPLGIEGGKEKSENNNVENKKSAEREGSEESACLVLSSKVCNEVLETCSHPATYAKDTKVLSSPKGSGSAAERASRSSQGGDSLDVVQSEGGHNSDKGNRSQTCSSEEQQQERLTGKQELTGRCTTERQTSQSDSRRRPTSLLIPQGCSSSQSSLPMVSAGSGSSSQSAGLSAGGGSGGGGGGGGGCLPDGNGRMNGRGSLDGVAAASETEMTAGDHHTEVVLKALSALQREMRQALAQDIVRQQSGGGFGSVVGCSSSALLQQQPSLVWGSSDGPQLYYTSFPPSPSSTSTDSRDTSRPGPSLYHPGTDSQSSSVTGTYFLPGGAQLQQYNSGRMISKGEIAMPPGLDPFVYSNPWAVESDPIMVLPPRLYFGS